MLYVEHSPVFQEEFRTNIGFFAAYKYNSKNVLIKNP